MPRKIITQRLRPPRKTLDFEPHNCVICGEELKKLPKETAYNYNKRKSCHPDTGRDCRFRMYVKLGKNNKMACKGEMPPQKPCLICGDIIPYDKDTPFDYKRRKYCRLKDKPECFSTASKTSAKNAAKSRKHWGTKVENSSPVTAKKKKPLSEKQRAEPDRQQREIDSAVFFRNIEQYTSLPAVSLPPEQIRELEKVYSPPRPKKYVILPHFNHEISPMTPFGVGRPC